MHIDKYERRWLLLAGGMLTVFIIALVFNSVVLGLQLPGIEREITPAAAAGEHDVSTGWVRELAPGRYEVNMIARVWAFEPNEIRIPVGSTVTFYVHSVDVVHGIKIQDTTVSLMILPGQTAKATYTFDKAGEYPFVCHEYCGAGHHFMSGLIIVEEI